LGEPPCTWAARPWPAFVASDKVSGDARSDLKDQISRLQKLGDALSADWHSSVLELSNTTTAVDNANNFHPLEYLTKAKYYDVIGRDVILPRRTVRWCVTSQEAHDKCKGLKMSAYSRDIRPAFECVRETSITKCFQTIRDNGADIITVDATAAIDAKWGYNLIPVAQELYGISSTLYAVGLVKSNSKFKSINSLKGARSCHTHYMKSAGWVAPLNALLEKKVIAQDSCPYDKAFAEIFSEGSCVPGVPSDSPDSLTKLCPNITEDPTSYEGPIRCLLSGQGDIAFTKHIKAMKAVSAKLVTSGEVKLLCGDGRQSSVENYADCNFGLIPPHVVLTSNQKTAVELDEVKNALYAAANLYGEKPYLFNLFGEFAGKNDLLFLNEATGLGPVQENPTAADNLYQEMLKNIRYCENKQKSR